MAAFSFGAKDIQEALFPFPAPTIKSFASYIKRELIPKIAAAMDFDVSLSAPTGGLSLEKPNLNAGGLDFGSFGSNSTRLFPPSISVDDVDVSSECPSRRLQIPCA